MKYKIGDKVKIKNIEDIKEEEMIFGFPLKMDEEIHNLHNNRIVTICSIKLSDQKVPYSYYLTKEFKNEWMFNDYMIECLAEDYHEITRFDILDLQ